MGKLVSLGVIAAAVLANPAMAAWYDKSGAAIAPSRVVHCIRGSRRRPVCRRYVE
jgi:hypothetical protein